MKFVRIIIHYYSKLFTGVLTLRPGFYLCLDDVFAKLRTEYDALDPNDMLSKHWDKWSSLQATGDAARNARKAPSGASGSSMLFFGSYVAKTLKGKELDLLRSTAELKGSIGEGPNHSNHSNHSNFFKIQEFSLGISKFQKISTFPKLSAKFR